LCGQPLYNLNTSYLAQNTAFVATFNSFKRMVTIRCFLIHFCNAVVKTNWTRCRQANVHAGGLH